MSEYGEGDIFITDVSGPALNLALGSGKFKDATAGSGIPTELKGIGAMALADFDNDGHVDMVLPRLVHFGFGSAARIEKLTIRWPSGEVQEFQTGAS